MKWNEQFEKKLNKFGFGFGRNIAGIRFNTSLKRCYTWNEYV